MSLRTTLLQYSKPFVIQGNVTSFEAIQVEPLDGLCAWRRIPGADDEYALKYSTSSTTSASFSPGLLLFHPDWALRSATCHVEPLDGL